MASKSNADFTDEKKRSEDREETDRAIEQGANLGGGFAGLAGGRKPLSDAEEAMRRATRD